jgi:hypothetical protein
MFLAGKEFTQYLPKKLGRKPHPRKKEKETHSKPVCAVELTDDQGMEEMKINFIARAIFGVERQWCP